MAARAVARSWEVCPPNHTPYASEMLASNAATAHELELFLCGGMSWWPCGDHWHVGHATHKIGDACKHEPAHRSLIRRKAALREVWENRPGRRFHSRSSARRATIDSEALADQRRAQDPRR